MKVLVLMSTYNGEKYLDEQINSILTQDEVEVYLLIRDDGSKDKTCEVLENYARQFANIQFVKSNNLGFVKSFSELVRLAQYFKPSVDYYAFSDQDDVWMSHKLKTACDYLSRMDQNNPLLFSSNSLYVDEHMNELGLFHKNKPYRTKENVMIYPTEQGCSMVFNKKAVELYNLHHPTISWHDRWMCLICNFMGEMTYCQEPLFYYRLHGNNTLGSEASFLQRFYKDFAVLVKTERDSYSMAKEFLGFYQNSLSRNDKSIMEVYINYRKNLKKKWILLSSKRFQENKKIWNRIKKGGLVLLNRL